MTTTAALYDSIVIGAGVSGLAAASHISSKGHRALVLEARDRIGGRIDSAKLGEDGLKVDRGASFVHGFYDNPIHELVKKLDIPLRFGVMESGPKVMDRKGELPPELGGQIAGNMFNTLFGESREHASTTDPSPTSSLASYMYSPDSPLYANLPSGTAQAQATAAARAMSGWTGAKYEDVSLRWWGFERDTVGPDGAIFPGRYGGVVDHLKEEAEKGGAEVRLGEKVVEIRWDEAEEICTVTTQATSDRTFTRSYTAKHIICTLPLGVLKASPPVFDPPLPPRKLRSIRRLGFGLLNKVFLKYERAWWRDAGTAGMYLVLPTPGHEHELLPPNYKDFEDRGLRSQALAFQNFVPVDGTAMLQMFLGAELGMAIEAMDEAEVVQWAHRIASQHLRPEELSQLNIPAPTASIATKWLIDTYSLGSYTYITARPDPQDGQPVTPLDLSEFAVPIWRGVLGFAGEHTHCDRYASVHGAYESGMREGKRVAFALEIAASEEEGGD